MPQPPRLVVLDPIVSMSKSDSHKNAETRRDLGPLLELMEKVGCGVLGINHFAKDSDGRNAMERVIGSVAFANMPRLVNVTGTVMVGALGAASSLGQHFIAATKHNISKPMDSFTYDIVPTEIIDPDTKEVIKTTKIDWRDTTTKQAQDLLDEAELSNRKKKQLDDLFEAEGFLREMLENGPKLANDIITMARRQGISTHDLNAAKSNLGVVSQRRQEGGRHAAWEWVLPQQPPPEDVPF
jgi:hypothetical protein